MDSIIRTTMLGLHHIIKKGDDDETKAGATKMLNILFRKFPNALPQPEQGTKRSI